VYARGAVCTATQGFQDVIKAIISRPSGRKETLDMAPPNEHVATVKRGLHEIAGAGVARPNETVKQVRYEKGRPPQEGEVATLNAGSCCRPR